MTENEAEDIVRAKLKCMELELLACIEKGCDRKCDDCDYNYAQGNMGSKRKLYLWQYRHLKSRYRRSLKQMTDM